MTVNKTPVEGPLVQYEVLDRVAFVRMNRPSMSNAQNSAMTYALDDAFQEAVNDDNVAVIVLAGNGKHFSAGHDIGPTRDVHVPFERRSILYFDHSTREAAEFRYSRESEAYLGMCRRWAEIPKPTIAMVQGACIAGGLMLAWSCDFIIASDDAFFADPTVRMGINGVEYFDHPWALNPRAAKELLFTGDRFPAQRAYELGMVNHIVPRESLEAFTREMGARISTMPRFALTLAKKAVNLSYDAMGRRAGMDAAFGLHHLAHSHQAEVTGDLIGGMNAKSMKQKHEAADASNGE